MMTLGVVLVMAGCGVMLLGSLTASSIALMLWLPYCVAVFGQSLNYPISLSRANDGAPIAGAYAMALSGFIHQLMAAMIGAIASLVASPSAWPLALLCSLLAVGAMLCVTFTPTRVSP